jgi:cytochrome bd-type quinol oxidase subunit 2
LLTEIPSEFYAWAALVASPAVCAGLVYIIVSATAQLAERFWKWGTLLYAWFWAVIVLILATLAVHTTTEILRGVALFWVLMLCPFNAFLVAFLAGKMNDMAVANAKRKEEGATQ